jgi:hypothetical protein
VAEGAGVVGLELVGVPAAAQLTVTQAEGSEVSRGAPAAVRRVAVIVTWSPAATVAGVPSPSEER